MKRWQFWLGVGISGLFLWLALRGLRLQDIGRALEGARYGWLAPGVAVYFLGVWSRTWRWQYLLRPIKHVPLRDLFPIVTIGYMGNNIFPARAGEVLRAYVLRRNQGVPVSASLATVVVERVFDGVVMLGFVIFNLPALAAVSGDSGFVGDIRQVAVWGTAIFAGVLIVFLLAALFPHQSLGLFHRLIEPLIPGAIRARAVGLVVGFWTGLEALRSPRSVLMVFLTSVVTWLLETAKYWFVMHAFPFQVNFFALMLMNGIVNLATTLPAAPGYVGTFDLPGIAVLQAYGVDKAVAAGYTLVLHVALWLPITALGAYYMTREGLSWTRVRAAMGGEAA